MGSGPSPEQSAAAASQRKLTDQEVAIGNERNAREGDQYNQIKPYAFSRLNNGNPYTGLFLDQNGGTLSRAYAPAYAAAARRDAGYGGPSGSYDAAIRSIDLDKARAFDDSMRGTLLNDENTRSEAARLITGQQQIANPGQFFGLANSGNNSIMQAPLQSQGIGGILGGIAGSALQGAGGKGGILTKIPF